MSRTNLRTVRISGRPGAPMLAMGTTTQKFFAQGVEHEATQWKNAHLPPDDMADVVDPASEFASFDKIPKKRNAALTILAIAAFLFIGSVAWTMTLYVLKSRRSVNSWAVAMVGRVKGAAAHTAQAIPRADPQRPEPGASPPAASAALPPDQTLATSPAPAVTESQASASVADGQPDNPPARGAHKDPAVAQIGARAVARAVPSRRGEDHTQENARAIEKSARDAENSETRAAAIVKEAESGTPEGGPPLDESATGRQKPLKGYVWSPSAGALVPARNTNPDPAEDSAAPRGAELPEVAPTGRSSVGGQGDSEQSGAKSGGADRGDQDRVPDSAERPAPIGDPPPGGIAPPPFTGESPLAPSPR